MNSHEPDRLDNALSRLPKSIQPEHDLWPGIAAGISVRRTRQRHRWNYGVAAAAVALAVVALTWVSYHPRPATYRDNHTAVIVPAPSNVTPLNKPDTGMQFASDIASDNALPMAARSALADNLRLLNDEIQRTQAAIKKYPNDINLQALLLDLYQQEARLVNDAQQAQIQTRTRTSI